MAPLNYRSQFDRPFDNRQRAKRFSGDFILGFMAWIMIDLVTIETVVSRTVDSADKIIALLAISLAAMIGMGIWMRFKRGSSGFIVGVLLAMGMTCLLPVGIFAVICGKQKL